MAYAVPLAEAGTKSHLMVSICVRILAFSTILYIFAERLAL